MIYYQVAQYDQVVSINAILTGWNELIMGTEETAGLIPTLMASQTESMELFVESRATRAVSPRRRNRWPTTSDR